MLDYFRTGQNVYSMPYTAGTISYVTTEGYIITDATIVNVFNHDDEAYQYIVLFYNFFERDGWIRVVSNMYETYTKNGVTAIILTPSKRLDGLIVSGVLLRNG